MIKSNRKLQNYRNTCLRLEGIRRNKAVIPNSVHLENEVQVFKEHEEGRGAFSFVLYDVLT